MDNHRLELNRRFVHSLDIGRITSLLYSDGLSGPNTRLLGEGRHFRAYGISLAGLEEVVIKEPLDNFFLSFSAAALHRWHSRMVDLRDAGLISPFYRVNLQESHWQGPPFILLSPLLILKPYDQAATRGEQLMKALEEHGVLLNDQPQFGVWQGQTYLYDLSDMTMAPKTSISLKT